MSSASVDERHGTFLWEISTTIGPNDRLYNKTTTKGHDDEDENNKQADYWHFVAFAFLGAPMDVFRAPMASSSSFAKAKSSRRRSSKKQQQIDQIVGGWVGIKMPPFLCAPLLVVSFSRRWCPAWKCNFLTTFRSPSHTAGRHTIQFDTLCSCRRPSFSGRMDLSCVLSSSKKRKSKASVLVVSGKRAEKKTKMNEMQRKEEAPIKQDETHNGEW